MKSKANMQWLKSLVKQFPTHHHRNCLSAFFSSVFHGMRWKCWQGWCHSYSVFAVRHQHKQTWGIRIPVSCCGQKSWQPTRGCDSDSTGPGKKQDSPWTCGLLQKNKQKIQPWFACRRKALSEKNNWLKPMAFTRTFHQETKGTDTKTTSTLRLGQNWLWALDTGVFCWEILRLV